MDDVSSIAPERAVEELRALIDTLPVSVSYIGRDLRFRCLNVRYQETFGLDPERVIGRSIGDVLGEPHITIATPYIALVLKGEAVTFRSRIRRPDGSLRDVRVSYQPRFSGGSVEGFTAMLQDITDQTETTRALRSTASRYRALFEVSMDGMLVVNDDGFIVDANESFCQILRTTQDRIIGTEWRSFVEPDRLDDAEAAFAVLRRGGTAPREFPIRAADGTLIELEWSSASSFLPGLHFCTCRDVTERKSVEGWLIASERRLRTFFENVAVGMAQTTVETGRFIVANAKFQEITGYSEEELLEKTYLDVTHPDDIPRNRELFDLMMSGQTSSYSLEKRYLRKDGSIFWANTTVSLVRDENGRPLYTAGVIEDITERRRAEEQVAVSKERLQRILEGSPIGLALVDKTGRMVYANDAVLRIIGLTRDDLKHPFPGIKRTAPMEQDAARQNFERMLRGEIHDPYEKEYIHPDGRRVPVLIGSTLLPDGEIVCYIVDMTAQKHAEAEVRAREWELETAFRNIPDVIARFGRDKRVSFVSAAFERNTGMLTSALTGRTLAEAGLPETVVTQCEGMIDRILASSEASSVEIEFERPDGAHWFIIRGFPEFDNELRVESVLTVTRDITIERQAEAAVLAGNEELRHINAELEQYAYAASHDLQEPLRMISIYTQMLERTYGPQLDARAHDYLEIVVESSRRMSCLVRDLLTYSRLVAEKGRQFGPIDMNEVVRLAMETCEVSINESGAYITVQRLPVVFGATEPLVAVVQNLLTNAIKYAKPGEPPRVSIEAEQDRDQWIFSVTDSGIGMKREYLDRIWGVFKRLHGKEVPGTGIGLAIVKKIVEQHGGCVWAESELGAGSTFYFRLRTAETDTADE